MAKASNGLTLAKALDSRKTNKDQAVSFLILDEEKPQPTTGIRGLKPGEVGYKTMDTYPDAPYSKQEFGTLLSRTMKGCAFMLEHMDTDKGYSQLGFLCELLEATQCMTIAHMANHELNEKWQ